MPADRSTNATAAPSASDPSSLVGRHVRLRPVRAADYDRLYEWAAADFVPWHWQGRPVGPEAFQDTLWMGVLAHFVIEIKERGTPIGLFTAYGANFHHQFCYAQLGLVPDWRMRGWPIEAGLIGVNYLFTRYNFRKIYGEIGGDKMQHYESAIGDSFRVEGRLRDHVYTDGGFCDMVIVALTRAAWADDLQPMVNRLHRIGPRDRPATI